MFDSSQKSLNVDSDGDESLKEYYDGAVAAEDADKNASSGELNFKCPKINDVFTIIAHIHNIYTNGWHYISEKQQFSILILKKGKIELVTVNDI